MGGSSMEKNQPFFLKGKKTENDSAQKKAFQSAVQSLKETLDTDKKKEIHGIIRDLIAQSELIVNSMNFNLTENIKRAENLEKIINWANHSLKGTILNNTETLALIEAEIKNESFADDSQVGRVILGTLIAIVGLGAMALMGFIGIFYSAPIFAFSSFALATTSTLLIGLSVIAELLSITLISMGLYKAIFQPPSSVGREIRLLNAFFETENINESESTADHQVDNEEVNEFPAEYTF
jgi:hypothetical protein